MHTIHVWPRRIKEFLLTHPLYKSPQPAAPVKGVFDIPAGSMETTIEVRGLKELERALSGVPRRLSDAKTRAHVRIGFHCVREAKANAPRSPTKKLFSKTLKRKRATARRQFFPGGLEKSIRSGPARGGGVSVFVARNSYAGAYARRIHDEKGVTWRRRGPGTVAKGVRADEKFIARAVADNADKYRRIYEQEIRKELKRL